MSAQTSPGTGRRSPLTLVCQVGHGARSTGSATPAAAAGVTDTPPGPRGPRTSRPDAQLVDRIRQLRAETPVHGEG